MKTKTVIHDEPTNTSLKELTLKALEEYFIV